jgi:hypothetical protein
MGVAGVEPPGLKRPWKIGGQGQLLWARVSKRCLCAAAAAAPCCGGGGYGGRAIAAAAGGGGGGGVAVTTAAGLHLAGSHVICR